MGILLGLFAALCWGSADFFAREATQRIGTWRTLVYLQIVAGLGMTILVFMTGEFARVASHASLIDWLWAIGAGAINALAGLAFYRAFEIGALSIVSPIAASYAAITVLLAVLSGETLKRWQGMGIAGALVGVGLAAIAKPGAGNTPSSGARRRLPRGVLLAILASLAFGLTFWLYGEHVTPALGGVLPIWVTRITTFVLTTALALAARQSVRPPSTWSAWWLVVVVAVLDTVAYIAMITGMAGGQIAIVNVMASLFSAVTVLLAWIFLRERLRAHQWAGVALIFMSILLVRA
jgi:drug/metabolite transporter (DMT)-like permease